MSVSGAREALHQAVHDYGMRRGRYARSHTWDDAALMARAERVVNAATDELIAAVRAEAVASPVGHLAEMRRVFDLSSVSVEGGE